MAFKFEEEILQSYYVSLSDALKMEFQFTKQVAAGQVEARPDVVEQFVKRLNQGLSLLDSIPMAKIGVSLVQAIAFLITRHRSNQKKKRLKGFADSLLKCETTKQYEIYLNNIAREIVYRYGNNLLYFIRVHLENANYQTTIETLAHVAALRIMFYALQESISIESCEALVNGLIDGYQGLEGGQFIHALNNVSIYQKVSEGTATSFSAEGFYSRCGYVIPSDQEYLFYIDRDVKNKFVSVHNVRHRKLNSRNYMVPKYGYAMTAELPITQNFPQELGRHFPVEHSHENPFIGHVQMSRHQFVSAQQLERYLQYTAIMESNQIVSFSKFLQITYPQMYRGESVVPIYRGEINESSLNARGMSFQKGIFERCDFSFCKFSNINFRSMAHCLLIGSELNSCSATGGALSGADLTLASVSNCNFRNLAGILVANFGNFSNSYFNNSRLIFQYEGLIMDPVSTDSFVDCTTEVSAVEGQLVFLCIHVLMI